MKDFAAGLSAIVGSILLLAFLSVVLSKQSQTPNVIQALATALAQVIQAAVTPVKAAAGGSSSVNSAASSVASGVASFGPLGAIL